MTRHPDSMTHIQSGSVNSPPHSETYLMLFPIVVANVSCTPDFFQVLLLPELRIEDTTESLHIKVYGTRSKSRYKGK
jgi:hypothetical protein